MSATVQQVRCVALASWLTRPACADNWRASRSPPTDLSPERQAALRARPCATCLYGEAHAHGLEPKLETRRVALPPGERPVTLERRKVDPKKRTIRDPATGEPLSVGDVAARLGVSRRAIYRRIEMGQTDEQILAPKSNGGRRPSTTRRRAAPRPRRDTPPELAASAPPPPVAKRLPPGAKVGDALAALGYEVAAIVDPDGTIGIALRRIGETS